MSRNDALGLLALIPSIAAIGTALTGFAVLWFRRFRPADPLGDIWEPGELLRAALTEPAGLHAALGRYAHEEIAEHGEYVARHCEEEIPPSVWFAALRLSVVERAKALTAELGNYAWRPARPYRTHSFA